MPVMFFALGKTDVKYQKNQRKSYFELQQPFDLFEGYQAGRPRPIYQQLPKRTSHFPKLLAMIGFILLLAIGIWLFKTWKGDEKRVPFVFVELRAVSPQGNPLAGAEVRFNRKLLGVTDSFGEWRRYLRLKPGSKIQVEMKKAFRGYHFTANKTLKVPLPRKDGREAEIKSSLALNIKEAKKTATKKPTYQDYSDPEVVIPHENDREKANEPLRVPSSYLSQNHLNAIDIRHVKFEGQYGNLMEKHQANVLRNRVIPELIAQIEERGIRMDRAAGWKYLITYIPQQGQVGLVRGEVFWRDHRGRPQKSAFITGFSKTVEETATALLELAKRHVSKEYGATYHRGQWYLNQPESASFWALNVQTKLKDPTGEVFTLTAEKEGYDQAIWRLSSSEDKTPCTTIPKAQECPLSTISLKDKPPYPRWSVRKMRIQGNLPPESEIYVSGYQAYPLRDGFWAFWGDPNLKHLVTVIKDQKILHRSQIDESFQEPATLRLPGRVFSHADQPATRF